MIERVVEPELLDALPPGDPRAIHSRRDLRRINLLMRNSGHILRVLNQSAPQPKSIIELGCGDGTLVLRLAKQLAPRWIGPVQLTLLDMQPAVRIETVNALEELGWKVQIIRSSIQEWLKSASNTDLILANLFLHHFSEKEIRLFFARCSTLTRLFVSCDPRRWRPALLSTRLLRLIGCNDVTCHDARVSVRAGFRDRELTALWPSESGFLVDEYPGGYASHLFAARRAG